MPVVREELLKAALELSEQDRIRLAGELMGSVTDDLPGLSVDAPEFLSELTRRSNDGPASIPWDQVKADLQADLGQ
jgi:DNA repair ATPase RecN